MDFPLGLASALKSGECVLFLGSGVGHNLSRANGTHAPDAEALAKTLSTKFSIDVDEHPDLAQVAQVVELRHGRARLIAHLENTLKDLEPDEDLQWLASLTWKAIFTTNYDRGMERCYELIQDPTQNPVVVATNSETRSWDPKFQVPLFHLHGSLFSVEARESILVTEQDYARFRERRRMLFDALRISYASTPILYVGYSHRDPNWKMVTAELRAEFEPNTPPQSYRVTPHTPDLEKEILAAQGITTLDGALTDLRFEAETHLGKIRVDPRNMEALAAKIPSDLRDVFDAAPAAVSRLLNSWDYVNQADFGGTPNTFAFHRGDRANWALIGKGINFQRDVEESLVDKLVEFATDPRPRVTSHIVLGPAGYGMSTLLMAVTAWFAQNKVGTTLFLRPGMTPTPADVEFAARYFPSPIVFCVDNAADFDDELAHATKLLQAASVPAFLLLGERLNEWRQCRPSMKPTELQLEPLSDEEIVRLVDSLGRTGSLGRLADLDADLRFSSIKIKNQQELLVTMREATEGKAFDAIIEDEFRNIDNDRARDLYGLVCAFTRLRSFARDMLCATILDISPTDLYALMVGGLEGIVVWETIDEARGLEALRARHQIIADIVWNRCLDRAQRERVLLRAMDCLNLTFGVDAKAFEAFTRDVDAIDSLQTLEAKSRFFEVASRKDPRNGFVRQHYGRMLRREGKFELALSQLDRALELAPGSRAIRHTRGVILRDMALDALSPEVARRRLAQSEAAFEGALTQNPRDEYSYQSLAELYLDWAVKATDERETVDYITKAQDVVFRGLREVRQREGLYLVSSKIEKVIGDTPRRISALERALREAPTSAVVRFVLGSLLRREHRYEEAGPILLEGLTMHPDDPHLALALALTFHESGKEYRESIGVLYLARLRGARDPHFVAVYGGMLVMDGQLADAQEVWRSAAEENFSFEDLNRHGFRPTPSGKKIELTGRVTTVKAGYSFIASPGFPNFFCPGPRYSGFTLREDAVVRFEPAFSARGPMVAAILSVSA
jgi:tetratricopeptide (TPR) repeat protein